MQLHLFPIFPFPNMAKPINIKQIKIQLSFNRQFINSLDTPRLNFRTNLNPSPTLKLNININHYRISQI
jgi:hypothetical protein